MRLLLRLEECRGRLLSRLEEQAITMMQGQHTFLPIHPRLVKLQHTEHAVLANPLPCDK
jgi:hypothetical protein